MSDSNILILGGAGFLGRNLLTYLLNNNVASFIRVADKAILDGCFLAPPHTDSFKNPKVDYQQMNLINPAAIEKAFKLDGGKSFKYVFNLACETLYGKSDEVYVEKVVKLAVNCAHEAVRNKVEKFIEVSTTQVYPSSKKPIKEEAKLEPRTKWAKFKLQTEEALKNIPGLNLVIIRPAMVYGPGDVREIIPRLICGAIYKKLNKRMKTLWSADLQVNTVHVNDVSKSLWHAATKLPPGTVWNVVDKNETTQGKLNKHIEGIFGIKTGFISKVKCQFALMNLALVTEEVNRRHLKPWAEMLKESGITNCPLSPYVEEELIIKSHLCVDGSAIEATGFRYDVPHPTDELLKEEVNYFLVQNLFPKT